MKYKSRMYTAKNLYGSCELYDRADSIRGIKEIIDRTNERAIENGYKPDSYMIVCNEWESETDENGMFLMSSQVRRACQIYPARVD